MKKIICIMLVIMSFAGSAFAAAAAMTSGEPTTSAGLEVRGGADSTNAPLSPTPLIKFSTGVFGMVNFAADAATKTSNGYIIFTRHLTGSKYFSAANDTTSIYWRQAPKVADGAALITAMKSDLGTATVSATVYAAGQGWTAY